MVETGTVKSEMRAILRIVNGQRASEIFKLKKSATIFGREKGDVILNDNEVSSSHCQIQFVDGEYIIFDMNSSNGTYVNGVKIVKHKLKDKDKITLGKSELLFELLAEESTRHISTLFQGARDTQMGPDRTRLIDSVVNNTFKENPRWQILLAVTYENGEREEYRLAQSIIYLGRASTFGRFEKDPNISRRHLMIKLNEQGEVFVEDQGSTNGTFLNGSKIKGIYMVGPHDNLQIGSCQIKIQSIERSS